MSMDRDFDSELLPPTGILFIAQAMYEYGEPWWNDVDRGKLKNYETNFPQCLFVRHKSHMD
jgi:hypothetical protein